MGAKMSSLGVIGEYYDQIALDIISGSGNYRLGIYDDSSGPVNLKGETGSVAVAAGYTWRAIPEFPLNTQQNWVAHLNDTSGFNLDRGSSPASGRVYRTFSFAALPSTWGTPDVTDSSPPQCKMGHS